VLRREKGVRKVGDVQREIESRPQKQLAKLTGGIGENSDAFCVWISFSVLSCHHQKHPQNIVRLSVGEERKRGRPAF
jgi:hypothetical protein